MREKWISRLVSIHRYSLLHIIEEVLFLVSPFAFIGSISNIIAMSFFTKNGFFNELFHISQWLPHFSAYQYSFKTLSTMTMGLLGVYTAYQMASVMAKHYHLHTNDSIVGLTSVSSFLILTAKYISSPFGEAALGGIGYQNILVAIMTGYIVALFFKIFNQKSQHLSNILFPMSLCIFIAFGLNKFILLIQYYLKEPIISWLLHPLKGMLHLWQSLFGGVLISIFSWVGFVPHILNNIHVNLDNLEAGMLHQNMPYPFDAYTLFYNYGQLMLLGFVIALMLFSHQYKDKMVGKCSFIPTLFNQNQFLYVATPLLFNITYLPGMVIIVLFNMISSAIAVACHIIPTSSYSEMIGLPIPFLPLVSTNGSIIAFIFGILLLLVDIYLWRPFIQLDECVMRRLENSDENRR